MITMSHHQNNPHVTIASDDQLSLIEAQVDRLLDTIGVDLEDHAPSLEALRQLGARIDYTARDGNAHEGEVQQARVRIDGAALREFVSDNAPGSFLWRGARPETSLQIGNGQKPAFLPVYGPPNVRLQDGSRATGTIDIYRDLVALCNDAKGLQSTGFMTCFVHGLSETETHLRMAEAHLALSDKPFMGTVLSKDALIDVVAMMERPATKGECNLVHLINATPPLTYQRKPLECLQAASERGECSMVSSYMMMGATSPVTPIGTVIQGYAEILIGLALSQVYRPGCPVVFGMYAMPFCMQNMIPIFGDPISSKVQLLAVQLARRLGIPSRGDGGVTNAKIDDAQAGYDGAHATFVAAHGGANIILHSAGWAEGGRCTDMQKLIREGDMLHQLYG